MSQVATPSKADVAVKIELPETVARRGIDEAQWRTLCNSLYPGANPQSVLMVIDYCKARRLDPLKKPCHIVPMEVKDARTGKYEWRDVVMPGVYEHRTTAQRTMEYLGHSVPEYGPEIEFKGLKPPAWCAMTMYRWNVTARVKAEFPVRVLFAEVVALTKDGKVNARWTRAGVQMLTKCTEAAGLREAFPDEIGGESTAEEMDGQRAIDIVAEPAITAPQRKSQNGNSSQVDVVPEPPAAEAPEPAPPAAPLGVLIHQVFVTEPKKRGDPTTALVVDEHGVSYGTSDANVILIAQTAKRQGYRMDIVATRQGEESVIVEINRVPDPPEAA